MSTKSNVYSQGGGGTGYEFEVQTAFMIQFLIGGKIPGLADSTINSIRLQSGSLGFQTDDLLLECSDNLAQKSRVLFQIKHTLTISEKNPLFVEVLKKIWKDFQNSKLFNPHLDKIYIVKNYLTSDEKKHLKVICSWAKVKSSSADFINEVERIAAKKTYLNIFENVLKGILKRDVTADEIYSLFFCLDFLEYDFGESASTAKSNFLTVIEHSKDESSVLTSSQIWDTIFSFVSHADNKGGSFDIANIPAQLKSFLKNTYYISLQKKLMTMSKQGFEIIDLVNDKIGNITLQRPGYLEKIITHFISENIVIITGEPGSGKSVIAKNIIKAIWENNSGYVLIFKADELNNISLRDYFLKFDINITVSEIFSFFPLHSEHLIYVDSFEKLLEGEGTAFKQLQQIASANPKIKILVSCREAELPLIKIKYFSGTKTEPVKIELLSDDELSNLQYQIPSLSSILKNRRIHSLLKIPKYLDFAYRASEGPGNNFSDSDEPGFIQSLWDIIIENKINNNKGGLPIRRGKQFIELAIERAKKMVPYIIPQNPDVEALTNLENDGVVVKSSITNAFTPAHDILEDWALIKHVDGIFFEHKHPSSFFPAIGKEPAMRRAYRLWTLQALKTNQPEKIIFLKQILTDNIIQSYWQDESVIALLHTPFLQMFLQNEKELLLKDEWALFSKLVQLLRTSCREYESIEFFVDKKFVPVGEGWNFIIHFIDEHKESLPEKHYDQVLQTINDWHYVLYKQGSLASVAGKAGNIIKYLLENHYINQDDYYNSSDNLVLCVRLFLDCTGSMTESIKEMIEKAALYYEDEHRTDENKKKIRYYEKIVELVLTGLNSIQVARFIPETLIKLMRKEWILHEDEDVKKERKRRRHSAHETNEAFGLTSEFKRNYFPASAFQTPVYWLLKYHPVSTIDFIIDLLNHSVNAFVESDYAISDERSKVTIYLPEGNTISQHGSSGLWSMFRGTGISTPYLLNSVLMALEKYLLELGEQGLEQKELFQLLIEKLITKSNTVSLTAVVSSVAQACPLMMGKWITCLFSARKMIYWDVVRFNHDHNPLAPSPLTKDKIFQKERITSNQLPHRLKNQYGLKSFIVHYCFNYREYNKEIFTLLDKHKKAAKKNDWEWQRILFDIDIRNWKVTNKKIEEDKVQFQIEPVPKGRLKKEELAKRKEMEEYIENSRRLHWMQEVMAAKVSPEINRIKDIITYYRSLPELNPHYHHPGLASAVAIRYFWNELAHDERQWCFDIVSSIVERLIHKEQTYDYLTFDVSPFDDDAAGIALPLLLNADAVEKKSYLLFLTDILFSNIGYDSEWYKRFFESFNKDAWQTCPDEALHLWMGLIQFAKIDKKNPFYRNHNPSEQDAQAYDDSVNHLKKLIADNTVSVNINEIDFSVYSHWVLIKAIRIIPVVNTPEMCTEFLLKVTDLIVAYHQKSVRSWHRDRDFNDHIQTDLEEKLAQIILWNAEHKGKEIFARVIDTYYNCLNMNFSSQDTRVQARSIFRNILTNIIYITSANLPDNNDKKLQKTIACFQIIWKEFFRLTMQKQTILSGDLLFLNIGWNENARHWKPLEVMGDFFKGLISIAGNLYPGATVNLLSHVGDQTLLPEGLTIFWKSMQKDPERPALRSINHIEQLVYRVYNYHLTALRANPETLNNYISLLDELIKEGSSDAYWIREYLVSFR